MDAPDHTRLRRLVQRGFTPKSIAEHEALVRRTAEELIDAFPTRGDVDLVESFARPLPMRVITRLLGIPDADLAAFDRWGEHLVTALDRPRSRREATDVHHALVEIDRAFRELVAERRRRPGDDLISVLAEQADGDVLTDDELVGTLSLLLMIAGFETTVNLIGTGTATLVAHRDQLELLAADPEAHLANTRRRGIALREPRAVHAAACAGTDRARTGTRDPRGAVTSSPSSPRPTVTRSCSPIPTGSTSPATTHVATSHSSPARTPASAARSRDSKLASRGTRCCAASPT